MKLGISALKVSARRDSSYLKISLDGNAGGLDELIIPDPESQVELIRVSGVNPGILTMTTTSPDFFLASADGYGLEEPRACYRRTRLSGRGSDDYLVIEVSPHLNGAAYGRAGQDIQTLVLATRHAGQSLFPVSEWPLSVHVAVPKYDLSGTSSLSTGELDHIAWGEIYRTKEDAIRALT